MVLELFIAAACILEILRISLLVREMRTLAIEKGEDAGKWTAYTVLLWVLIEAFVIILWYISFGYDLTLVAGVILAILIARMCYFFLKRSLEQKNDDHLEERIEEIGKSTDPHT